MLECYEESVYAGILGKVIGVYMGRPIEGMAYEDIKRQFGLIKGYVHQQRNVPLIVPDDDISGTLTFFRALEDSGLYADTPEDFFGKTWLNYIIENKTILWWGHIGRSTEHTAFLRLKEGVPSPRSGSSELNGRLVAEQIGAQIFIDAFGLASPGNPSLAEKLARRAARVSHDGEAVDAAVAVAVMVSLAFVEKDMEKLLDAGARCLKKGGILEFVYRDVRSWSREDGDWEKTFGRIKSAYGYDKYGGGCHVVPNHAVMVMAWCYAPDDFYRSQVIVNSAGWDTDCNAANVGCLMGVKLGLSAINRTYEFQKPFADTVYVPSADGTYGVSDVLEQSLRIADSGRKMAGWPARDLTKAGSWHHWSLPGSLHGYSVVSADSGQCSLRNEDAGLTLEFSFPVDGAADIRTPVMPSEGSAVGYGLMSSPRIYSGQTITVRGSAVGLKGGPVRLNAVIRYRIPAPEASRYAQKYADLGITEGYSPVLVLEHDGEFRFEFVIPDTAGFPVEDFGFRIASDGTAGGRLRFESVGIGAGWDVRIEPEKLAVIRNESWNAELPGFVSTMHFIQRHSNIPEWHGKSLTFGTDSGDGVLVTGNLLWKDYEVSADMSLVLADAAGLVLRYQGLERWLAVFQTREDILFVERRYGEKILRRVPSAVGLNEVFRLSAVCRGRDLTVRKDGRELFTYQGIGSDSGGAGFITRKGAVSAVRFSVRSV
jgi:ADP-ribosylglycohydrolase